MDEFYICENEYLENIFLNIEFLARKYFNLTFKIDSENEKEQILDKNRNKVKIIFEEHQNIIEKILNKNKNFISLLYIKKVYNLNGIEWFCFCIFFMAKFSCKYEEIFKNITKDIKNDNLIFAAFRIYYFKFSLYKINDFYKNFNNIKSKFNFLCLDKDGLFDENLFEFIMTGYEYNFCEEYKEVFFPKKNEKEIIRKEIFEKILSILKKCNIDLSIFITAEEGQGKKFLVESLANEMDMCVIIVDVEKIFSYKEFEYLLIKSLRESIILNAMLCFYNLQILNIEKYKNKAKYIFKIAKKFLGYKFFLSNENIKNKPKDLTILDIQLKENKSTELNILWKEILKKKNLLNIIKEEELSNIFNFSPGQIASVEKYFTIFKYLDEKPKKKDLIAYIKKDINTQFGSFAQKVNANYSWDDLIIKEEEKQILKETCDRVRYKNLVFDIWGMDKKIFYGKGVNMLFSGQSGTGKTMAASVIASDLGLDLYRIDISQTISKYIGDTEKNIHKIFEEAKKSNIILLFDEVDAFLGKRCETKDSHDRNANIEISYLLQKMEEYEGICIMTTNFLENIDKAFFRRINYVVHFSLPQINQRVKIWDNIFKKNIPINKDVDFKFISKFELCGGSIKNAALSAAFFAAADKTSKKKEVSMKHILKSIKYELKKQGRFIQNSEFGKYSYLLETLL